MTDAQLQTAYEDPMWRLHHIYWILDKDGNEIRFRPNAEQDKFFRNVWFRNLIPKARQIGFSTAVQIMLLDACVFTPNTSAAVIAQDLEAAKKIRKSKLDFAWQRLPENVKEDNPLVTNAERHMVWKNGSTLSVTTSSRSGTVQFLHISEFGKIAKDNIAKAEEIISGSIPSVPETGIVIIESTVESSQDSFSAMVRTADAREKARLPLTIKSYRNHFTPWYSLPEYSHEPEDVIITKEDNAYFERIEAETNHSLTPAQKRWYVLTRINDFSNDDERMHKQYPSTLREALEGSKQGKWLSKQMAAARTSGRILELPWRPDIPVNTFWDIGRSDDIAIWFGQDVGPWVHWIDFWEGNDVPYLIPVQYMQSTGYVWGRHYLPHDAAHRAPGAQALKTSVDMLHELGLRNIEVVERIPELVQGIDQLRDAFPSYRFDVKNCSAGIDHLDNYAKVYSRTLGEYVDVELKDGHDHAASAIRQHAQWRHLIFQPPPDGSSKRKRKRASGRAV